MDINDVRATRAARNAFGRRGIDIQMADVRCMHGVVFVRGCLQPLPKYEIKSVEGETYQVQKILRRMPEVKDVVLECTYKEKYFR